jgi:hypothetical protein
VSTTRPHSLRVRIAIVAGGIAALGGLVGYGVAKADPPAVEHDKALLCRRIDKDPTEHGVAVEINNMLSQAFTPEQVGNTLGLAARDTCPEHKSLMIATLQDWRKLGSLTPLLNGTAKTTTAHKGVIA